MKFIEHSNFDALNSALNFDAGIYRINGRIESYSCKLIASEKKQFKLMNASDGLSPNDLETLSPPVHSSGSFSNKIELIGDELQANQLSRKTLFYLVSTLNASFNPDYDFSSCGSDEFSKEPSIKHVMDAVDSNFFSSSARQEYNSVKAQLWSAIDIHINLSDCEIYSFNPHIDFDPTDEHVIWSFYYFFYSKKFKRVVFFACRAARKDDFDSEEQDTGYTSFEMDLI